MERSPVRDAICLPAAVEHCDDAKGSLDASLTSIPDEAIRYLAQSRVRWQEHLRGVAQRSDVMAGGLDLI